MLFWFVLSGYVGVANFMRTRYGQALIAVRDHYLSAEGDGDQPDPLPDSLFRHIELLRRHRGRPLWRTTSASFSAEAFTHPCFPSSFLPWSSSAASGSVASSVLGTAFVLLLPQVMQAGASTLADFLPAMQQGVAYIKEMSIGAAIMLFLIFEPEGLITAGD